MCRLSVQQGQQSPKKAALSPIFAKPEALPFETVAMDFIVKLPLSEGFDSILTITDHDCTKMTVFHPMQRNHQCRGSGSVVPSTCVQKLLTPPENNQRSRHTFHRQVYARTMPHTRDSTEYVHGVSPTNRRTVRTEQPMGGTVLPLLH
jgi:hypothetical protein